MKPAVGFVGLGNIGAPLCHHLLARGYPLKIHDVDVRAVERFRGTTAEPISSLAALARSVDVVLLSLPNSDVVERVIFGEDGLADGFSAGKALIDMSSSKPSSTRYVAGRLAKTGVHMLDAPVSGGVLRAEQGKLAMMVGGEQEVFERHREVLASFGDQIFYVGAHGTGHLAKALNNLMSATTLASAAEAVLLGVRAGLDPERLLEVINASSGRSNSTEVKFPRYILNRAFDDGFAVGLMNKDLKIALETASEFQCPTFIGSAVGQVWQAAVAAGFGAESHTAIYAFLEELLKQRDGKGEH
jgi:3-hydroxyisobutyrate dehydrogenase-like beta-hydroxyacid dehydrogenase